VPTDAELITERVYHFPARATDSSVVLFFFYLRKHGLPVSGDVPALHTNPGRQAAVRTDDPCICELQVCVLH
jgi:hypothetical protein